ncbi:MAG: hypothetical protein HQL29_01480 [Candidatus Omnitrophica bacterium]|nr:hypothetical protein [Candidatus Omnitrophota bacterium]
MKKYLTIMVLIFSVCLMGVHVYAEEYMTDSGEIRETVDGDAMTDSGEIEEIGEDGDYMTDSGEVEETSSCCGTC